MANTIYYFTCSLMVALGVGLIYLFTLKILKCFEKGVRLNWLMFIAHITVMVLLVFAQIFVLVTNKLVVTTYVYNFVYTILCIMVCCIIVS